MASSDIVVAIFCSKAFRVLIIRAPYIGCPDRFGLSMVKQGRGARLSTTVGSSDGEAFQGTIGSLSAFDGSGRLSCGLEIAMARHRLRGLASLSAAILGMAGEAGEAKKLTLISAVRNICF
jgi:hypothetical protein